MKPQFKLEQIYLDLSKLSEEQQRKISVLINGVLNLNSDRFLLSFNPYNQKWELHKYLYNGKELTYSQFLDMMGESEEVLQVDNYISIEELTKLCNDYNRNTLKITNLERDLDYKRSWSKESIAIKEIHKEVSHAQAIKENAKSKLQEIGIVF